MSVHTKNPLKLLLRKEIKAILSKVGDSSKAGQSSIVAEKVNSFGSAHWFDEKAVEESMKYSETRPF